MYIYIYIYITFFMFRVSREVIIDGGGSCTRNQLVTWCYLVSEHASPHLHELRLVEAAVLVLIERVDEVLGRVRVKAHAVLKYGGDLVGAQHPVAVLVETVEAAGDVVIPAATENEEIVKN